METASFSLLELFKLGGVVMWPLLAFSIAAIGIMIERIIYLTSKNLKINDLKENVIEYLNKNDTAGACDYLSEQPKKRMGAGVLLATLAHSKNGKAFSEVRAERAAQNEAVSCINSLENGFNFLTALGSLSPLTGFLGTVTGMIGAFRSIAEASEVNAQIVANGIYEALITTVFGLIVAIIAMISHSIFSHIVDKFASGVEGACSEIITLLSETPANN